MSIAAEWILVNFCWISSGSGFWFVFLVHFWLSSGIVLAELCQNPCSAVSGIFAPGQNRTEDQNSVRILVGLPRFG